MRQIVLDTETTGLDPKQGHKIIEIGCVEIINRKITRNHYHQYIQPDRDSDEGALAVHGITSEFLADKVRQRLANKGTVVEKKMMGGLIFMINDKMCIGVDINKNTFDNRKKNLRDGKSLHSERAVPKEIPDFAKHAMKGMSTYLGQKIDIKVSGKEKGNF